MTLRGLTGQLSGSRVGPLGLLAFLIPLVVRAIPEMVAGPYPIGWDTIAFYVPATMDWAAGKAGPLYALGEAPLLYLIAIPAVKLLGIDPVLTFKILGPVFYGFMIFSAYLFIKSNLGWQARRSFLATMLAAFYFVTLRIGWDLYRTMLGLGFLLLGLQALNHKNTIRGKLELSSLLVLAVLSNQFTGVLFLAILGARATIWLTRSRRAEASRLIVATVPGLLLFVSIVYAEFSATGGLFPRQPPVLGNDGLFFSLQFAAYAYLPLLPFAALGAWRIRSVELSVWTVVCLAASVFSSFTFLGATETGYRWVLLLTIPLSLFAANGLSALRTIGARYHVLSRLMVRNIPSAFGVALLLSAALYIGLPAQQPLGYYSMYPSMVPTSMLQSTIPASDAESLNRILTWVTANSDSGTALVTHQAFYGWTKEYLKGPATVINYGYHEAQVGVETARERGYTTILTIWWINGEGWHGHPLPPEGFVPVRTEGTLAVLKLLN